MTKAFKDFFIIFIENNISEEIIDNVKSKVNEQSSAIFFNADKKYLKHLNSVKRIFENHCEAQYLIVYTNDINIFNGLKEIHNNSARYYACKNENEFTNFILKGGEINDML